MTDNWLVEGADCIVIASSLFGDAYDRAQRGTVGKVGKTHFTVVGVTASPIRPDLPLVKFRVATGASGGREQAGAGGRKQAGSGRMVVYPPDSPHAARALADYALSAAGQTVDIAYRRWSEARMYRSDARDARDARGAALYALADAVAALRAVYDEQGITDAREDQDR